LAYPGNLYIQSVCTILSVTVICQLLYLEGGLLRPPKKVRLLTPREAVVKLFLNKLKNKKEEG